MPITCADILNVPQFQGHMKLVAGQKGLDRPIRWTHFLESEDAIKFLQGDELVFTTAIYIRNDTKKLLSMIELLNKQHVAGLVINIGQHILKLPQAAIDKADEFSLPLFEIPWQYKLVEATRIIGKLVVENEFNNNAASRLLENILFLDDKNYEEYINTAEYYGYDLTGFIRIGIIRFPNLKEYLLRQENTFSKHQFQLIVQGIIDNVLRSHEKRCLFLWRDYSLIMTIPVEKKNEVERVDSIFNDIKTAICRRFPTLVTHNGLGSDYDDISRLKRSYNEAVFSLKLCRDNKHSGYVLYRNAGIYKFFNKINDVTVLNEFYQDMLGDLVAYDEENHTEFLDTLRVYFEEGENTLQTVGRLYIHRNTLKYRLKRIEEILQLNLSSAEEKINLQIAFKIKKYLELAL